LFEREPELAPDLEWMLLSGQANEELIITALIEEAYPSVYRLAYLVHYDPSLARRTVVETLASALLERHRYSGHESVQAWLATLTLMVCSQSLGWSSDQQKQGRYQFESDKGQPTDVDRGQRSTEDQSTTLIWQAVRRMDETQRLPLILQASFGLSPAEMVAALDTSEPIVTQRIESALRQIEELLGVSIQDKTKSRSISIALERSLPSSILSERDLEHLREAITLRVHRLQHTRRRRARFQEIGLVGLVVVVVATAIFIANQFIPQPAMEAFVLPTSTPLAGAAAPVPTPIRTPAIPTATQVLPTPVTPAPALPPLTLEASPEDIRQRMQSDPPRWYTLWADLLVFHYGPAGYVGPPRIERHQVWSSRHQGFLHLKGLLGTAAVDVIQERITEAHAYEFIGQLGSSIPWFSLDLYTSVSTWTLHRLFMVNLGELGGEIAFIPIGMDQMAGRETLIVDKIGTTGDLNARYWIDTFTGVALREQYFIDDARQQVLLEVFVRAITYDVDFPAQLFARTGAPQMDGFAADHTGRLLSEDQPLEDLSLSELSRRMRRPKIPAPPGLDPSRSRLTFQYNSDFVLGSDQENMAAVFAGDFYLGDLLTGDPMNLFCKRSPDGIWLALLNISQPGDDFPQTTLRVANLADLSQVYTPFTQASINEFYFSQDSHRLAFKSNHLPAPPGASPSNSVYIAELHSDEVHHVIDWRGVLVGWAPDGEHLLLLDWDASGNANLSALHPETGQTYAGEIEEAGFTTIYFFPETGWRGAYHYMPGDLGACAAPPERIEQ
jgi:DNA-directed RNA polymerase specialized sigma24 family protein